MEEIKRAAYWKRIPLARIARWGILLGLDELRSEVATLATPDTGEVIVKGKGEPYPPRMGELDVGRPSDV